ncbi:hypothetical protein HKD37_15G043088 [Glycine soja]
MSAQRGVVLIPQRLIQTVTQTNVGCTSKKILPAWLPWEEFMRDPQPFTTSLCCMIKGRLVLRRLKMQMLLVPTDKVILVGQALNTFLVWPTHLVKRLSEQGNVSPAKPTDRLFNSDFPLYIKHEDLSKIAHSGQCLSIFVIQLWILHLTKTSMRLGNFDVYGFLEPQSIQRFGQSQFESKSYMKNWMQSSKWDVYLGAYLNGAHWQMVIILPKENLVVWFCSLHNRTDNYLKGIINSKLNIPPEHSDEFWVDCSRFIEKISRSTEKKCLVELETNILEFLYVKEMFNMY